MKLVKQGWFGLAILLALTASQAYAGGGKTRIQVFNKSKILILVAPDDSTAIKGAITGKNLANFLKDGGQVINTGDNATFDVKAGTHLVVATDDAFHKAVTDKVDVKAGATLVLDVVDKNTAAGFAKLKIQSP